MQWHRWDDCIDRQIPIIVYDLVDDKSKEFSSLLKSHIVEADTNSPSKGLGLPCVILRSIYL